MNCIPRVTQPTLVLKGELDFFLPVETSQKPMVDLLVTPHEHRLTNPDGHSVPQVQMIRQTLGLDRSLGPVG